MDGPVTTRDVDVVQMVSSGFVGGSLAVVVVSLVYARRVASKLFVWSRQQYSMAFTAVWLCGDPACGVNVAGIAMMSPAGRRCRIG